MGRKMTAILVHLYTASGALLAFLALVDIAERRFSDAFLLLLFIFWIDYTDGTFARAVGVSEVIPLIDGTTLDHVIDFFTNAVLPVFIMWQAEVLPPPRGMWMGVILLASLFRFARAFNPWLSRGFFTGIPSPWINLAFYLYFLKPSPEVSGTLTLLLVALTFLPLRYIHVARFSRWKLLNSSALAAWWMIYLAVSQGWVTNVRFWLTVSLLQPCFYVGASWFLSSQLDRDESTST